MNTITRMIGLGTVAFVVGCSANPLLQDVDKRLPAYDNDTNRRLDEAEATRFIIEEYAGGDKRLSQEEVIEVLNFIAKIPEAPENENHPQNYPTTRNNLSIALGKIWREQLRIEAESKISRED